MITVSLFIAGKTERQNIELPDGATVAQLKSKVSSLGTGVFKNLTSRPISVLEDTSVLTDGMCLSFAPTEVTTNASGQVTYSSKKISGATDVVMTPVKLVRQEVFLETTFASVLTVGDVLAQAGITPSAVYIDGVEVGRSKELGANPVTIEVRDASTTVDTEDGDEECDW